MKYRAELWVGDCIYELDLLQLDGDDTKAEEAARHIAKRLDADFNYITRIDDDQENQSG